MEEPKQAQLNTPLPEVSLNTVVKTCSFCFLIFRSLGDNQVTN